MQVEYEAQNAGGTMRVEVPEVTFTRGEVVVIVRESDKGGIEIEIPNYDDFWTFWERSRNTRCAVNPVMNPRGKRRREDDDIQGSDGIGSRGGDP